MYSTKWSIFSKGSSSTLSPSTFFPSSWTSCCFKDAFSWYSYSSVSLLMASYLWMLSSSLDRAASRIPSFYCSFCWSLCNSSCTEYSALLLAISVSYCAVFLLSSSTTYAFWISSFLHITNTKSQKGVQGWYYLLLALLQFSLSRGLLLQGQVECLLRVFGAIQVFGGL